MARNTLATDVFDRTDANDLGANWSPYTGSAQGQIFSNRVQPLSVAISSGFEQYNAVTPANNQWAGLQIILLSNVGGYVNYAVYARLADPNTITGYLFAMQNDQVFLGKQVAGSFTSLASVAHTYASTETLFLECVGTGLEGYINGTSVLTTTDSDIASGKTGLGWFADTGAATSDIVMDNFSMGDFTAGTALVHRGLLLGVGI